MCVKESEFGNQKKKGQEWDKNKSSVYSQEFNWLVEIEL